MNRRQKIIISVTGIFLVLLILVGLTYAYFLTRIDGNDAEKSITVTTKNLHLTYSDGNGELTFGESIVPGDAIKFLDGSGNTVDSKTFSVTNNGDDTDYVVFIDDVSITYASDIGETIKQGDTTTFESNDFRFTLTCTITSTDSSRNNTSCNSVEKGVFPLVNESSLVGNKILKGDVHNYTLTMEYIETGRNQSNDMNKSLTALINIEDINRLNPYKDNESSLAYNIIENARKSLTGTKLVSTPPTKVGENYVTFSVDEVLKEVALYSSGTTLEYADSLEEWDNGNYKTATKCTNDMIGKFVINIDGTFAYVGDSDYYSTVTEISEVLGCDGDKIIAEHLTVVNNGEQVLSTTSDDYGTSYYYRGNVLDNFVNFAGMCWRIVRIQGDGSIKLVLDDKNTECNDFESTITAEVYSNARSLSDSRFGMKKITLGSDSDGNVINGYIIDYINGGGLSNTFQSFQEDKLINVKDKLKTGDWCVNDNAYVSNDIDLLNTDPLSETEKNNLLLKATENFPDISYGYYYDSYIRLNNNKISLKCNGTNMTKYQDGEDMKVGTLTVDELIFSGSIVDDGNREKNITRNYLSGAYGDFLSFQTLSPSISDYQDHIYVLGLNGIIYNYSEPPSEELGATSMRSLPSIILNKDVIIESGDGTQANPYVIVN